MADVNHSTQGTPSRSRPGGWLVWIVLALLVGVYLYASRSKPQVPAAFAWGHDLDAALAQAAETNRLVFVDFHATWCGPCRMMDADVFSQSDVADVLADWVTVKIDVDEQPQLADRYGTNALPTLLVLSPKGEELTRAAGALNHEQFIDWIQRIEQHFSTTTRSSG